MHITIVAANKYTKTYSSEINYFNRFWKHPWDIYRYYVHFCNVIEEQ